MKTSAGAAAIRFVCTTREVLIAKVWSTTLLQLPNVMPQSRREAEHGAIADRHVNGITAGRQKEWVSRKPILLLSCPCVEGSLRRSSGCTFCSNRWRRGLPLHVGLDGAGDDVTITRNPSTPWRFTASTSDDSEDGGGHHLTSSEMEE
jgi:hypothetical protein